jgi:hypothetical protein
LNDLYLFKHSSYTFLIFAVVFFREFAQSVSRGAVAVLGTTLASRRKEQQAEVRWKVMRLISENPEVFTRQVAGEVGILNGSVFYVIWASVEKRFAKVVSSKKNPLKGHYADLLTPKGIREKFLLMHSFIERKYEEFELLKAEIIALGGEAGLETASNHHQREASSD